MLIFPDPDEGGNPVKLLCSAVHIKMSDLGSSVLGVLQRGFNRKQIGSAGGYRAKIKENENESSDLALI